MQELIIILVVSIATLTITYMTVLLAVAVTGCFLFLNNLPDWTWTAVLLTLTIMTLRSFRYSPE